MQRLVGPALALLDALCVALALLLAWAFWTWRSPNLGLLVQIAYSDLWVPNRFITAGVLLLAGWLLALRQAGLHDPARLENSVAIAGGVTRAAVFVGLGILLENFVVGERVYPKGLVLPFVGLSWLILLAARLAVFRLLLRLERPPTALNAVIVGVEEDGAKMAERLERDARHVVRLVGHLRGGAEQDALVPESRVLGGIDALGALVNEHRLGLVIVFRSFAQADSGLNREKQEGSGLGLVLCQRMIELMGGSISYSTWPGLGCCFSIGLPACEDAPGPLAVPDALPGRVLLVTPPARASQIVSVNDQTSRATGKVFVKFAGQVVAVNNEQEAMRELAESRFHTVILHPRIGVGPDTEVVARFRQKLGSQETQLLAACSLLSLYHCRELHLAGADGCLLLPLDWQDLAAWMETSAAR